MFATLVAFCGTISFAAVFEFVTLTVTWLRQDAPPLPQLFTLRVCVPAVVAACEFNSAPPMDAVVLLPSSEKPIEVTVWPAQVFALAVMVNGDPTDALAAGALTEIPEAVPDADAPEEPDEPEELEELEELEPEAGCAVVFDDLPPQPTLTIVTAAIRVAAIEE